MPPEAGAEPTAVPADRAALTAGARALGLDLDAASVDGLLAYLGLLTRWNRVYNLTAVRDPAQMLVQHVLDSLAIVPPLRRRNPGGGRLLDVGSGAGLPGIVIAAVAPEWSVHCVDAVGKKASFVRQAAAELGLGAQRLQSHHARVEALAASASGYQVVTSRAFASLADFVALTQRQLAPGGAWMAMKGRRAEIDAEQSALPAGVRVTAIEPLHVPGLDAERHLVWLEATADAIG